MSNQPELFVYNVIKGKDGKKDFVNKLGQAFRYTTKDGRKGLSIPNLKLIVTPAKPEDASQAQEASSSNQAKLEMDA